MTMTIPEILDLVGEKRTPKEAASFLVYMLPKEEALPLAVDITESYTESGDAKSSAYWSEVCTDILEHEIKQ